MLARDLKSIVKTISPALTGATLPICNNIHFNEDRIWATNLEATVEVACDVSGVVASIPQKALKALLTSIDPKDDVELRSNDGSLVVRTSIGDTTLSGLAVEDVPETRLTNNIVASAKIESNFVDSFQAVAAAASDDQSRQILTGVLVEISDGHIGLTATDSYRLHHDELPASPDGNAQVVCPAGYIKALPGKDPVAVEVTENQVRFSEASVTVTVRTVDGEFPNYRQLCPASTPNEAILGDRPRSVERTLKAFERLAIKAGSSLPTILDFSAGEGAVKVSLNLTDVGEHRCDLPLDSYIGESLRVAFNPGFLRQAIAFGGMKLGMVDALKPAVLNDSNHARYALLMPVRLS
jgi:DNA polymerase-3 subunit beta